MKSRFFVALSVAAGLSGVLLASSVPAPVLAQRRPPTTTPPRNGNPGQGPNPSRGNAGRNSGVTTTTSTVLAPSVRFAPTRPTTTSN